MFVDLLNKYKNSINGFIQVGAHIGQQVNTFLEITGNSDVGYAMNILESNDWDLEKSIQLDTTLNNTENPLLQNSNILSNNSSPTDTTSSTDTPVDSTPVDATPVDATQEEQIRKPDAAHSEQLLPTGVMSSYNLMNQLVHLQKRHRQIQ